MTTDNLLILGGTGNTGRLIARLLLQETDCRLVLAGRNQDKAQAVAQAFNAEFGGDRVAAIAVDASDTNSLRRAMSGCRMAVIASSTSEFVAQVARAALEAQTDYLDVQYSSAKLAVLQNLEAEICAAGRCFITDGGFHPGLPGVLVRYAAAQFDRLLRANVGSVIKIDWKKLDVGPATIEELARELLGYQPLEYRGGAWRPASAKAMWFPRHMAFGREFGRQPCAPMFLEEMRALPSMIPGLQETGFFVGGFNWFVDWLAMPLGMLATKIAPQRSLRLTARLMRWGLVTFSKPPYGTLLKLEASGVKDSTPKTLEVTLYHPDGYRFTAIPVTACLLQYLDGSARKPGLWTQANLVDPTRLMRDMQRMGVEIDIKEKP